MSDRLFFLPAARAYTGVLLERLPHSPVPWVTVGLLVAWPLYELAQHQNAGPLLMTLALIGFAAHVAHLFHREVLCNDERPETTGRNIARQLSVAMVRAFARQEEEEWNAVSLLKAALQTPRGQFVAREIGLSADVLERRAREQMKQLKSAEFYVDEAEKLRQELHETRLDGNVILAAFLQDSVYRDLLNDQDVSVDDFRQILRWESRHQEWIDARHHHDPGSHLLQTIAPLGRSWVMGYTFALDAITTDLNDHALHSTEPWTMIQKPAIDTIFHTLSRRQGKNVLILGRPGAGKRTMLRNVARLLHQYETERSQPYTRVVLLHTEALIAHPQAEQLLLEALEVAQRSGRFILVIDNLATLIRSGKGNVLAVLSRFLQSAKFSLLALADVSDYHTLVKTDANFDAQFQKIYMEDPSDEETMLVLMDSIFAREQKDKLHLTYKALRAIVDLSKRYIGRGAMPGKALAVLEDSILAAKRRGDNAVTEDDVRAMVSLQARIDIRRLTESEREKLLQLEETLRRQIVGQDPAIRALVNTLKRARLDVRSGRKPIGTFLFLGPTGVGKTHTAKALAREYFGSTEHLIRLDMNEFSTERSADKLMGEGQGGTTEGYLARRVQDQPFSLVLLDEIEKAHPRVLNTLLQVLDEGMLTDHLGVQTDFRNTIIIATSNAGALFLREALRQPADDQAALKHALIDEIIRARTFAPEFVNRFDEVILYRPLSLENAGNVARLMIEEVTADLQQKRGIKLELVPGVVEDIVQRGYSADFGARELRRTVTDSLENYIADALLNKNLKRGDTLEIKKDDLQ